MPSFWRTSLIAASIAAALFFTQSPCRADFSDEECMECHGDKSKPETLVQQDPLKKSVHADLECAECHVDITEREHEKDLPAVKCAECHEKESVKFAESVHGQDRLKNPKFLATCTSCHGAHDMPEKKDPASKINPLNLPKTCGECHAAQEVIALFGRRNVNPVTSFESSVHGQKLKEYYALADREGKERPASCGDCHGSHGIYPPLHPKSTFSKFKIAHTCGKCHDKEEKDYNLSIHWRSVGTFGNYEAPVCFDCHGEHDIAHPQGSESDENGALKSTELCANCHGNKVLMGRFGLDANRFSSYMLTYHGLAALRNSPDAAKCVSCHEVHAIRSKSDPDSATHPDNLLKTCQKCHEGASADFVKISVHPGKQSTRNPIAYFFRILYIWMIAIVVLGMVGHNLIILWGHLVHKWRHQKGHKHVRRFTRFEVAQHFLLIGSFTVLTVTGFALAYPESFWAKPLLQLGLTEVRRAQIHRLAAIVLVVSSVLQMFFFAATRRGRREVRELWPRFSDLTGMWQSLSYNLGWREERPQFGRYDYAEKAEYLALIWGVIIMTVTGLILWFPELSLQWLPDWAFETAEVIHFFEALLAALAIFIWHFFFVIYHPERYPMNLSWLTGTITEEEQRHHHPLENIDELEEK